MIANGTDLVAGAAAGRLARPQLGLVPVVDQSRLCDQAASHAARLTGVPLAVLMAVTRVETGRQRDGVLAPWPWTVNLEGKGSWFKTRQAAQAYAKASRAKGAQSFDVGCFQINYRWHGTEFASLENMFDPEANALYAARFLRRLYRETGNWTLAVGSYHSRTPKYAKRYKARFTQIYAALERPRTVAETAAEAATGVGRARSRRFPVGGDAVSGRLGSLTPLGLAQLPDRRAR